MPLDCWAAGTRDAWPLHIRAEPISRFGEENDGAVGKVRLDLRKQNLERSIISFTGVRGGEEKY